MTKASHVIGSKKEKREKREREKDRERGRKGRERERTRERENRDNKKGSGIELPQAPSASQTPPLKLFRTSLDSPTIWRSAPWNMNFAQGTKYMQTAQ